MKKIVSVSLAVLFILYLAGLQIIYQFGIDRAKERSSGILKNGGYKNGECMVFNLSPSEFKSLAWTEKNKEFTFNKMSYDVISISSEAGKIKITCFQDKEESRMISGLGNLLDKLFSEHQRSDQNTPGSLISKILKEYLGMDKLILIPEFCTASSFPAKKTLNYSFIALLAIWHPPSL